MKAFCLSCKKCGVLRPEGKKAGEKPGQEPAELLSFCLRRAIVRARKEIRRATAWRSPCRFADGFTRSRRDCLYPCGAHVRLRPTLLLRKD